MEVFLVVLLTSALTVAITYVAMIRYTRSRLARLQQQLEAMSARMQRAGAALAAADVYAFEIPLGLNCAQPALEAGADAIAAVDFLANPAEFSRRVNPDDAAKLEAELRTLALQDGVRHLKYRYIARDGRESSIHAVTRLVRDGLGRPVVISGALLQGTAATRAKEAGSETHRDDEFAADASMNPEWSPFTTEHSESTVLDGDFIEMQRPRAQAAR
jgi:hypothetical protein